MSKVQKLICSIQTAEKGFWLCKKTIMHRYVFSSFAEKSNRIKTKVYLRGEWNSDLEKVRDNATIMKRVIERNKA